jgi:PrtD family type I secretion system ABC transporter
MRWLFAKQLRPFVTLAAGASLLLNLALLAPALYMLQVFDRVFASGSVETLVMLSIPVLIMLTLGYFMDAARARALAAAGRRVEASLAPAALGNQLHQSATAGSQRTDDALRDVAQLRTLLASSGVVALFDAPWVPLYLLLITFMHPLLGGVATLGAMMLVALSLITEYATRRHTEQALQAARATRRRADSLVRNAEAIVGMGMTAPAIAAWQEQCAEQHDAQEKLGNTHARLGALARMARQTLQAVALGLGAWLVIGREASPGIMIAATILLGRALQPVEFLISGWKALSEARSAWKRLCDRAVAGGPQSRLVLPAPKGRLDVDRIVFSPVPNRPPLIRGVEFSLLPGESLGLVGPSASGKTTLVRLLLGLRVPQAGKVRIDGSDIARCDRNALGRTIGYLPQDVELFAGTVAANIARLSTPDPQAVIRAAQLARAHELILRLPDGYETEIGEGGCLLSGGQRQRIALARALYGDPRLLILDEPNANLDEEGDEALCAALADLKARGVTVILVGHRRRVMNQLDKIAVLRNGALEAFGPTATILARLRDGAKVLPFPNPEPMQVQA